MLSYRLFAIECAKIALEAEGHPSKISLACLDAARKIELGIISDEELTYVKKRAEETAWGMAWQGGLANTRTCLRVILKFNVQSINHSME